MAELGAVAGADIDEEVSLPLSLPLASLASVINISSPNMAQSSSMARPISSEITCRVLSPHSSLKEEVSSRLRLQRNDAMSACGIQVSRLTRAEAPIPDHPVVEPVGADGPVQGGARVAEEQHPEEVGVEAGRVAADMVDKWGAFTISFHRPSKGKPHGSAEARCPFHALNMQTRCKKSYTLRNDSQEHRLSVLWALRHWCNQGPSVNRQRLHLGARILDLTAVPDRAIILQSRPSAPAPLVVRTDADLDASQSQEGQPQAQQGHERAPKAKARPKVAAQDAQRSQSSSSSSSSNSSSSSSS